MESMFCNARAFYNARAFNQPLGDWNVSQVRDMRNMLCGAYAFSQSLDGWDVSRVRWDVSQIRYSMAGAPIAAILRM